MPNLFGGVSSQAATLKNYYQGPIVSQFNDMVPFYKNMEKGKEKYNGVQVVRPIKVLRNPGIGATSDGGVLPVIGRQTTVQATISAKFLYLRFGLTAPLIKASQGDKGSFVPAMEFEMEQGMTDFTQSVNRMMLGDGTAKLATVSANAVGSNVVTVTGRESTEDGSKYLQPGMVVDFYTSAGALVVSGVGINAVSGTTTATLTLDQAVTVSSTDIVVTSGAYGNEVSGVLYTLDGGTSTIYGVNRSTYSVFQGNVVSNGGAALNFNVLKQAWNQGKQRGGAKYNAVYCSYDAERFYEKLLIVDKRYIGKVKGDGTFSNKEENYLEYGGIPLVADKDVLGNRFLMLDTSQWKRYVLSEMEWATESGSELLPQVSSDSFEVRLRLFFDMFCEKPSAQVAVTNFISP